MKSNCTNLCERLSIKAWWRGVSGFSLGFKYCIRCSAYFNTTDIMCPCCNTKMRSKSRNSVMRKNMKYKRYAIALIPTAFIVCSSLYNTIFI